MTDSNHEKEQDLLTYTAIRTFKDPQRFWHYNTDKSLFIFDQHISNIYPIADELRDLLLAEEESAFNAVLDTFSPQEREENNAFLSGILDIADEPGQDDKSRTKISTLKLNISSQCNLYCSYCFRDKEEEQVIKDKRLIFKAIDYLVNDCGRDVDNYTICFNLASEPLLYVELIEEIFTYIKKIRSKTGKKLEIFFITNGTLFNDKILKLLKTIRKERTISISIDGPQEFHDANRKYKNGEGSYDRIIATLEQLKKKRIRYAAEAVLTRTNPYPLAILQHLMDLGFGSVNIKPIRQGTPASLSPDDLPAVKRGYDEYFQYIEAQLLDRKTKILEVLAKDYALRPFWRILFNHKMHVRCTWGINTVSMDPNGDFYPCDSIMGFPDYAVGNVHDGINWEKFHQPLNCEIRGACGDCWARHICAGTCPVNTIIQGKDSLAIDPVECSLTRYLVEKNIKLICHLIEAGLNLTALKQIMGYNLYQIYLAK